MAYKDKEDERAYQRQHYLDNKELYKQRATASRAGLKEKGRKYVREYLESHPCVDCGNDDIRVLQFDHINPKDKERTVGQHVGSYGKLLAEIAKCEVRCANCHMIRTAEQFGWTRHLNIE